MPHPDDQISREIDMADLSSHPETATPSSRFLTRDEDERSKGSRYGDDEPVPLEMVPPINPILDQFVWEEDAVDFSIPSCNRSTIPENWNSVSNTQGLRQSTPKFTVPAAREDEFSCEESAYGFAANTDYSSRCRDHEIMHNYLPFHDLSLVDPELSVSAAYHDGYQGPFAHNDDSISLNHTDGGEDMSGLPNNSGQARSNPPPRAILEIFRAEKGWRPAPEAMFTTWTFGAVGERLMPAMISNTIRTDGCECL
ncbi:hypothetical protein LTS17_007858 [Exophiala oligosperma]